MLFAKRSPLEGLSAWVSVTLPRIGCLALGLATFVATGCNPEPPADVPDGGPGSGGGGTGSGGTPSRGGNTATGGSGGSATPGVWHGCKATISDATLNTEYAAWKTAYVVDCGDGRARVQGGGNTAGSVSDETVSEGIGYGMLLAVGFNDQAIFDQLWAYYKSNRNAHGLMNWKMQACTTTVWGQNGASDGDLDAAMALLQADRRWGAYSTDANALLDAIHAYETLPCGSLTVLKPGDAWGDCTGNSLNPSYFSPGYYRAFSLYQATDSAKAQFWNKLADDSITLLLQYQTQVGGALMSEWANANGTVADQSYGYNACRTPWRVAVDYAWWGTAGAQTFLTNVSGYVDARGGVANVPFDKNSAFLGPFALSGVATGKCDAYYTSWMSGVLYDNSYFQSTLRVLCLLVMSGKFTYPAPGTTSPLVLGLPGG
jgi:endo-1,4-beta-D-glucanase Y